MDTGAAPVPEPASVVGGAVRPAAGPVVGAGILDISVLGGVTVGVAAGSQPINMANDSSPMYFFISVFLLFSPRRRRAVATGFPARREMDSLSCGHSENRSVATGGYSRYLVGSATGRIYIICLFRVKTCIVLPIRFQGAE